MENNMETAPLEVTVRQLIKSTFQVAEPINDSLLQKDSLPNWDSLGHMSLVAAIEKKFGVSFPTYMLQDLISLDSIVSAVKDVRG
jgi:acyl carrier protein